MSPARGAFLAACYGHALCHASKVALPLVTLAVGAEAFAVTPVQMGWAVSAFILAMGASSVPAGLLGDRYGSGRVLLVYFWLFALGAAACALSQTYAQFLAAQVLLGLASGLFHPAGLGLVSLVTPAAGLGRAMGLFGVAGSVGLAFMPVAMGSSLGWRTGFLALAAAGLVGAVAASAGLRMGWLPVGNEASAKALKREGERSNRLLVLLLLVMSVNAFVASGWETIFPQTVADQGLAAVEPWMVSTFVLVVGGVGQYVGGLLARDGLAASRLAILLVIQCLMLLGTAAALDSEMLPFMFLGSFAFLNYGTQPIENRLLAAFTSTRRRSTAYALKFVVALAVAAPAPSIVAHLYEDSGGSQSAYRMLSAVALGAVFAGYLFLRQGRLQSRRAPRA